MSAPIEERHRARARELVEATYGLIARNDDAWDDYIEICAIGIADSESRTAETGHPFAPGSPLSVLFHKAWGQAKEDPYDKAVWRKLDGMLSRL